MPQLPTIGSTGWGDTLNEFLNVGHNSNGTLKGVIANATGGTSMTVSNIWVGSQSSYTAISSPASTTLYFII